MQYIIPTNTKALLGDILWDHLRALPAFRALIRAMEARLFSQLGPLPRPVLDIGSGDGHFAQAVWGKTDVGIDPNLVSLQDAKNCGSYHMLSCASATRLPFADNSFASVISNCVIEHIPDVMSALSEIYRVLRPGGQFTFSVPTDRLNNSLAITRALNSLGLKALAECYKAWFTRLQVHYHMYSPDEWQHHIETIGFLVVQRTGYMSPRATTLFDLGHFYGIPNLIVYKLAKQWVLWPWRPRFVLEEKLLVPLIAEDNPPGATCCFFVTRKD